MIRIIEPTNTEDFDRYYNLRWKILCAPWNQPRGIERDPDDNGSIHLMAINSKREVLAVGRLHFNAINEAQVRFMAVDTPFQRKGTGKLILKALEAKAVDHGADMITLNARETALGFYQKQGYEALGSSHMLFNSIAHIKMQKKVARSGGCRRNNKSVTAQSH